MAKPDLRTLCQTLRGLLEAAQQLQDDAPKQSQLDAIVKRGAFRPSEDEAIGMWFAHFLNVREMLWTVIEDVLTVLSTPLDNGDQRKEMRFFLVGYAAVCVLIRIDRIMLFDVAGHSIVQRKLNEPFPEYGIPRKQYTSIFSSFVDHKNIMDTRDAMKFANKHRRELLLLSTNSEVGFIAHRLPELETSLNPSKRSYLKRAWSYVSHKWRRRGVVTATNVFGAVLEGVGRTASEIYNANNKYVSEEVLADIAAFLLPGDVIVTRHAKALTNLFFPGFWPHSALYIGTEQQREAANISINPDIRERWSGDICVLEARKDGVRLRPLAETFSIDVFVVIRPTIKPQGVAEAIERALQHEGKMFNFDFDFFNSDRVVCTEIVYRGYDGVEGLRFPLRDRAGRKTLSAEDLLDFALDGESFTPVAIFGVDGCRNAVVYGDEVRPLLEATYDRSGATT